MTLLIIYFVFSIAFSFLCSILEAVLLSITPSYIRGKVHDGHAIGTTLEDFKEDIDRPLSAILTLNTIAHTVGAILVGAQASKVLGATSYYGISGEAIVAGLMTFFILILSEIIPKTIGANYWRSLVPFTVMSLKALLFILGPFVWLSQLITKNLKNDKSKSVFSRADLRAMTQAGEDSGALKKAESRTINNVLKLDQIKVKAIMTPRSVMKSTIESTTLQELYDREMPMRYSRIPVFDVDKEKVCGVMLKDDLYQGIIEGKGDDKVSTLLRPPVFISDAAPLTQLQDKLMETKDHLAVVTDEFGVVFGIVTWEDLMETILGLEIVDETDDIEDLQTHARELWEKRQKQG